MDFWNIDLCTNTFNGIDMLNLKGMDEDAKLGSYAADTTSTG
jgi:hypothetical protein